MQTKAALDYETKSTYSMAVSVLAVKDDDGTADTATDDTIPLIINVTDVDEVRPPRPRPVPVNTAPVFTEGTLTARSVVENTTWETNIGRPIAARDSNQDTLTFFLGGVDASFFAFDRSTGQIMVVAETRLDYEAKSNYTVAVTATDPSQRLGRNNGDHYCNRRGRNPCGDRGRNERLRRDRHRAVAT